jgi:hypothetical protein
MKMNMQQLAALMGSQSKVWIGAARERGLISDDAFAALNDAWRIAGEQVDVLGMDATDDEIEAASCVEVALNERDEHGVRNVVEVITHEFSETLEALRSIK